MKIGEKAADKLKAALQRSGKSAARIELAGIG